MITRTKVILFCYLYIAGIVLEMVAPADPNRLPLLAWATAASLIGALAAGLAAARGNSRAGRAFAFLLCFGALGLGYARHLAANTTPDTRIGEARFGPAGGLHLRVALPDTSRLRWRKEQPLDTDTRIRIVGELDARRPVLDADGRATMDAGGRWKFTIVRQVVTSETAVISAADPIGTDYVVPQPFSRLHRIELIEGPKSGSLALFRISNHIGTFSRGGGSRAPVRILGRVAGDPLVYDFKTVLPVEPQYIQYPAGGPFYRVEGGDLQVTIKPDTDGYSELARTEAYGFDVDFEGELLVARGAANPGGFDARRFMQNYNVYGLMNLFQPRGQPSPIRIIAPEGRAPRSGSPLVEFSLDLRDRVLRVFKLTMPYPQSAFLGGVTLGLRYGLPSTPCPVKGCEELVVDEFKEAGVNHVLAVSGLHVTIITAMFIGIFTMLRLPRQAYAPIIIFALVVFAIITGARPSTLRAVIMNSLFLLSWAYLNQGLRASALIGVPVAAFMILLQNPLVVVDPSFTLSFGAILSLALLTGPFQDLLMLLRGNQFAVALLAAAVWTAIGIGNWDLAVTPTFLALFGSVTAAAFVAAGRLQARGIGLPDRFSYAALPPAVSTFLAAQFGIQVGMMIPLSAYYFCRWPFAGAYANLVAIPLIGVVVQLGAIGGLLGLIPGIGIWLALLLNAANWLASTLFMWVAHFSAKHFPYPFVERAGLGWLISYYALCAVFIWRVGLLNVWKRVAPRIGLKKPRASVAGAVCALALLTIPAGLEPPRHSGGQLRVNVLAVGYGSSILIESPGGRNILVDAGFVEHERSRRNEAIRTVLPFLSHRGIRRLDALILTSPLPERAAGASAVLDHMRTDYLFLPPMLDGFPDLTPARLAAQIGRSESDPLTAAIYGELIANDDHPLRPSLAAAVRQRRNSWPNRWANAHTAVRFLRAGTALFEEPTGGGPFRIEVLHPAADDRLPDAAENASLVLRIVHGRFSMLLTSDLREEGLRALGDRYPADRIASTVLVVPNRGTALPKDTRGGLKAAVTSMLDRELGKLLETARPERAIFEFGNPRPVLGDAGRDARRAHEIARQHLADRLGSDALLSTDSDMAIVITSDGFTWDLETQAQANRAMGGAEDAVSDIAVGL